MKRNYWAMGIGAAMLLAGLLRMAMTQGMAARDPVLRVQQWSLLVGGVLALLLGRLAATRPRNAGFGVTLVSLALLMSGATAVPFHETAPAIPGIVLGLLGMAAGIYCMAGTRTGDS